MLDIGEDDSDELYHGDDEGSKSRGAKMISDQPPERRHHGLHPDRTLVSATKIDLRRVFSFGDSDTIHIEKDGRTW